MRLLITLVAYLGTLVVVAGAAFVAVLVVAGPHAGLLPEWAEAAILAAGSVVVLLLAALIARRAWQTVRKRTATGEAESSS